MIVFNVTHLGVEKAYLTWKCGRNFEILGRLIDVKKLPWIGW
jgi:hypothetical protein